VEFLETAGHTCKEARQAARHVLPGGTETKILMSGNLRSWRDFLAQRLAPGADLEIQKVAQAIYKILKIEFPNSLQDFDIHGMITTERLIQRALERHDVAEHFSTEPGRKTKRAFVEDVREILAKGLWVLQTDPWEEDKV
jgi:thymidylate synthase ThyX